MPNKHHKESTLKKIYAATDDDLLNFIHEDERPYNTVLSIREELMDRVLDECYKSYLKTQSVKFVVQCAYDALVKFLSFNFYYHPEIPDISRSVWISDQPIEPSPKDTWACDAVPIRPIDFKEVKEDIIFGSGTLSTKTTSTKETSTIDEDSKCCLCLEHVCLCLRSPGEFMDKVPPEITTPFPSKVRFSPKSSKNSLTGKSSVVASTEFSQEQIYSSETVMSEMESGTTVTSAGTSEVKVRFSPAKAKAVKKMVKSPSKPIEVEVAENILSESKVSLVDLPPIRVYSTFYSTPAATEKKTN